MRITGNQIFLRGLNNIMRQQVVTAKLQNEVSSGKKVQYPSDDPIAAAKIDLMNQRINYGQRLEKNRESAQGVLQFEESILSNSSTVLQRLRELQVQAGNGSMTDKDRKALADEARTLLDQLQGLANTQDSNGNYLFSGSKSTAQTITRDASGQYVYNGDQTQRFQPISSGLQTAVSDNGADLFMRIPNGNGRFTVAETATPNTGDVSATSGSVVNNAAYVVDDYTIQFVLNSQNQLVTMISGTTSGNVIPATGLPDDAPLYSSGSAITFNGMEVTLTGTPNPGDAFAIEPSSNESIFSTVNKMIANLNRPFTTPNDKARVQTENNQILEQLDTSLGHVLDFQAQVGARMNQLEVAENVNKDLIDISTQSLSQLEDVNMEEAIVQLNFQKMYLEIAQKTFVSIQGLSIFNYM